MPAGIFIHFAARLRTVVYRERLTLHAKIAIFTAYVAFAIFVRFILFLLMRVTWGLFKPAISSSSLGRDLVSQLLSSVPFGNLKQKTLGNIAFTLNCVRLSLRSFLDHPHPAPAHVSVLKYWSISFGAILTSFG